MTIKRAIKRGIKRPLLFRGPAGHNAYDFADTGKASTAAITTPVGVDDISLSVNFNFNVGATLINNLFAAGDETNNIWLRIQSAILRFGFISGSTYDTAYAPTEGVSYNVLVTSPGGASSAAVTIVLTNLETMAEEFSGTSAALTTVATASLLNNIGGNGTVGTGLFDGIIWDVLFSSAGAGTDHRWLMDEGSGTNLADSVGSDDATISPGLSGNWTTVTY